MSQDPLIEKLAKANGNVKKLCEFFAARSHWTVAGDCEESAYSLNAAASKLNDHLKVLIRSAGFDPTSPFDPLVEPKDAATHDGAKLDRFTTFLRDLDSWLTAQPGPAKDPDVIAGFQEMEGYLCCIVEVTGNIAGPETSESDVPGTPDDGSTLAGEPPDPANATIAATPDGIPQQLVLDDTEKHPMVQEFQGMSELTDECKNLVDGYLEAWEIEYSYYNRKRLLERILRWINSAPEAHALVIKMKTVEEPYEPYPSYVSRDVLAGNPPPKEPWS